MNAQIGLSLFTRNPEQVLTLPVDLGPASESILDLVVSHPAGSFFCDEEGHVMMKHRNADFEGLIPEQTVRDLDVCKAALQKHTIGATLREDRLHFISKNMTVQRGGHAVWSDGSDLWHVDKSTAVPLMESGIILITSGLGTVGLEGTVDIADAFASLEEKAQQEIVDEILKGKSSRDAHIRWEAVHRGLIASRIIRAYALQNSGKLPDGAKQVHLEEGRKHLLNCPSDVHMSATLPEDYTEKEITKSVLLLWLAERQSSTKYRQIHLYS